MAASDSPQETGLTRVPLEPPLCETCRRIRLLFERKQPVMKNENTGHFVWPGQGERK